jgi:putative membrane protein
MVDKMKAIKQRHLLFFVLAVLLTGCDKENDDKVSPLDQSFISRAFMADTTEVMLAQTVSKQGTDPDVKTFARLTAADHSQINAQLIELASELGISLRNSLDADHIALIGQLTGFSGHTLDSLYVHNEINDQQRNILLFQDEVTNGRNDRLRNLAAAWLPNLKLHLNTADSLVDKF